MCGSTYTKLEKIMIPQILYAMKQGEWHLWVILESITATASSKFLT